MPNWCSNNLEVKGEHEAVTEFYMRVKSNSKGEIELIESFLPIPEDQQSDWYNWSIANWGCKWSDSETELDYTPAPSKGAKLLEEASVHASFQTPWSPPEEAFKTISGMFPKLTFILSYTEEGMGFYGATSFFAGEVAAEAGGDVSDIEGMNELDFDNEEIDSFEKAQELIQEGVEEAMRLVQI